MAASAGPVRILVIDDEDNFSRLLSDFLRPQGYEVEIASDGLEGIRQATRGHFDLITLDIKMPGVNGVEALRSMQMLEQPAKVVIISGYLTAEIAADCRQAGAAAVLSKPVELKHLKELITELLGSRSSPEAEGS